MSDLSSFCFLVSWSFCPQSESDVQSTVQRRDLGPEATLCLVHSEQTNSCSSRTVLLWVLLLHSKLFMGPAA